MESVPKIVVKRLQSPSPDSHPDADLLAAFAEHSLAGPEQGHVVEHLARCADCREVVSLALPPQIESQSRGLTIGAWFHSTFRASTWRWAAVAAGVVLIASIGTLPYRHQQRSELASNILRAKPAIATSAASLEPPAQVAVPQTQIQKDKLAAPRALTALAGRKPARSEDASSRRPPAFGGSIGGPISRAGIASGAGRGPSPNVALPRDSIVAGAAVPTAPQQMGAVGGTSQTIEVQAEIAQAETAQVATQSTAQSQMQDQLIQNKEAEQAPAYATRVEKAKPASPESSLAIAPAHTGATLMKHGMAPAPRWTLSASGSLQRSLDGGQTWLDVNVAADDSMHDPLVKTQTAATVEVQSGLTSEAQPVPQLDAKKQARKNKNNNNNEKQLAPGTPVIFRALSVSSSAAEVWAGGSDGALYHTVDAGSSWARVLPSASGHVLTGDILSIQFSDPRYGTITTSTPEVWITLDDGQTWQKQQ